MATAQELIDEVRRVIHDETATYRWSDAELLDYMNAGLRQTVIFVPEANVTESVITVSNDIARQSLPTGGIKFIKASRNYADDGTTPQGVITPVEKDVLDKFDPDWEYDTTIKADGANFFEHYMHDPREKDVYYLYPPQAAANKKAAIVYSAIPTAMALVADTFPLDDEYINPVVQYIIFRSLTKESRDTMPSTFGQELWNNYIAALGLELSQYQRISPENNAPPEAP